MLFSQRDLNIDLLFSRLHVESSSFYIVGHIFFHEVNSGYIFLRLKSNFNANAALTGVKTAIKRHLF